MKVDFITRHAIPNYGSILQTYATQKVLEKLGCDSEVINYIQLEETGGKTIATNCHIENKGWKAKLKRIAYLIVQQPNVTHMHKTFAKFRKKYLKQTVKEYHSLEELKQDLPKADVYCTGSDQVWAKIGAKNYDEAYFLEFVPEEKRCISYAASFGKSKIDEELEKKLPQFLKKYETILVRENTAEEIIQKQGFQNVKQVLDPTLLLNQEEWSKLAEKNKLENKEYILVYQLHHNKQMEDYLRKLKKHTNLPIYRIHPSLYYGIKPGKFLYLPTPGQYISYIQNAKYIVTDSFHGTVFSLIFGKNFVDILPGETSTRIESILKLVGQEERIIKDFNNFDWLNQNIDYEKITPILEKERQISLQDFKQALMKGCKENVQNCMAQEKVCTGCRACEQLCPKHAITMEENEEGFLMPHVNEELCIDCKLCVQRCPQLKKREEITTKQECYAAKIKNEEILMKSSSGGIFSALANYVLEKKGKVYGATFTKDLTVEHIAIESKEQLALLRGSKYVQSNTKNTFQEVKQDLTEGKMVLYSGTPCQIAGLQQYLGKEESNLLTVDIVCHGVPSPQLFKKYKEYLEEKEQAKIEEFSFRDKEKGWGKYLKIRFDNGKEIHQFCDLDPYYQSFMSGDLARKVCYECMYANTNRVSDITIADYWGIEIEHPEWNTKQGVSAVIVNTTKGKQMWEKIKENVEYIPSTIEKIKKHNENLNHPTKKKKIREHIYDGLKNKDFQTFAKENLHFKKTIKARVKNYISEDAIRKVKMRIKK